MQKGNCQQNPFHGIVDTSLCGSEFCMNAFLSVKGRAQISGLRFYRKSLGQVLSAGIVIHYRLSPHVSYVYCIHLLWKYTAVHNGGLAEGGLPCKFFPSLLGPWWEDFLPLEEL